MAGPKKAKTTRGRNQDRARVAGGQKHEVAYVLGEPGVDGAAMQTKPCGSSARGHGDVRKRVFREILAVRVDERRDVGKRLPVEDEKNRLSFSDVGAVDGAAPRQFDAN